MDISSPAFSDGGSIPEKYGYTEENVNPPLKFSEISEEAETLVLIVDDPDAVEPAGKVWVHWLMWNISAETESIGEDEIPIGVTEGKTDFGERGYGGPNPPDGKHFYRFQLFALDTELELDPSSERKELEDAMEGHVIEEASVEGSFSPL